MSNETKIVAMGKAGKPPTLGMTTRQLRMYLEGGSGEELPRLRTLAKDCLKAMGMRTVGADAEKKVKMTAESWARRVRRERERTK